MPLSSDSRDEIILVSAIVCGPLLLLATAFLIALSVKYIFY